MHSEQLQSKIDILTKEQASKDALLKEKDAIIDENAGRLTEINEKMESYWREHMEGSSLVNSDAQ